MAARPLAVYLKDHLAGSGAALELLAGLERAYAGAPVGLFAAALREEVASDRGELEGLMARTGVGVSRPREAAAWLGAKASELKLWLDDPAGGALRLLEALDALSVGVEGKRLLWLALAAAAADGSPVGGPDYARLERRAEEQRRCIEVVRREAARAALGGSNARNAV